MWNVQWLGEDRAVDRIAVQLPELIDIYVRCGERCLAEIRSGSRRIVMLRSDCHLCASWAGKERYQRSESGKQSQSNESGYNRWKFVRHSNMESAIIRP